MAMKLDFKGLPVYVKWILAVVPAVVISLIFLFVSIGGFKSIMDLKKEIKTTDAKIDDQNNQIATSIAKGAKLETLKRENEQLLARLSELKEHLPEENEVSTLLKQVSDLSINSGLDVKVWRPSAKRKHPSGIVYEIPVSVSVTGTYHDLGGFLSSITKLSRIVNVNNLRLTPGGKKGASSMLNITFTASTFSALSEKELAEAQTAATKKGRKKK